MDTAEESFASEWQYFKEARQVLREEADQLSLKLASLTQDPAMKALLEEKRRIKNELSDMAMEVRVYEEEIRERSEKLERRRRALTDGRLREELEERLKKRLARLASLEELRAPEVILNGSRELVFDLGMSIEELERHYLQMNAESRLKQQESQSRRDQALRRITFIDSHYRQTKHNLENAIREIEERRQEHRAREVEWATSSRAHLEWMLEQEPSYKGDIVPRYKTRYPEDHLLDLFPALSVALIAPQGSKSKKRRERVGTLLSPGIANTLVVLPVWRFWVTFSESDEGEELSQEREPFMARLQVVLERAGFPSLSVVLVYNKLQAVIGMTVVQRQMIKKLTKGEEPNGWKIVRAGRRHRLFLLVDEQRRFIRFLPRQRKKAYSQH